ncbi:hypothetical protein [Oceanicaulis sp.]|uniref:hypothetical protein n=1 Tax=Oceanicaulis sp. TaxID=1924941 RepID=UPI003D26ABFF
MSLPVSLLGWLNLMAYLWALAAYAVAAYAGVRALHRAYDGPPAAPFCLIAAASRWVLGREFDAQRWTARDFIALGVFGAVIACLIAAVGTLDFITSMSWRKLGGWDSLHIAADKILTGSALIVMHCGVAHLFKREGV